MFISDFKPSLVKRSGELRRCGLEQPHVGRRVRYRKTGPRVAEIFPSDRRKMVELRLNPGALSN